MLRWIKTLLVVCLLGSALTGCAGNRLTPFTAIEGKDVVPMQAGVAYTPDRDGCFYSLKAEAEIMEIKREALNK